MWTITKLINKWLYYYDKDLYMKLKNKWLYCYERVYAVEREDVREMNKWLYCYERLYAVEKDLYTKLMNKWINELYVVEKDLYTKFILDKREDVREMNEVSSENMLKYSNLLKGLYAALKINKDGNVDKIIERINKLEKVIDSSYTRKNYSKKYVSKIDDLMKDVDKFLNDDN